MRPEEEGGEGREGRRERRDLRRGKAGRLQLFHIPLPPKSREEFFKIDFTPPQSLLPVTSSSMQDISAPTRDQTFVPLNLWTAMEAPGVGS